MKAPAWSGFVSLPTRGESGQGGGRVRGSKGGRDSKNGIRLLRAFDPRVVCVFLSV